MIANSIAAYTALKFAGALYLMYLGLRSLRNAGRAELTPESASRVYRGAYLQGVFNNLLNPKGALFYLGVFTQVIRPDTPPWETAIVVAAMVATSTAFWIAFVYTLHLPQVRTLLVLVHRLARE